MYLLFTLLVSTWQWHPIPTVFILACQLQSFLQDNL